MAAKVLILALCQDWGANAPWDTVIRNAHERCCQSL